MFIEQRLYTFAPGKSAEFDKLYRSRGARRRSAISGFRSATITARSVRSIR